MAELRRLAISTLNGSSVTVFVTSVVFALIGCLCGLFVLMTVLIPLSFLL